VDFGEPAEVRHPDDDNCTDRLTSANDRRVIRYDEPNDWWVPDVSSPELTSARVRCR
jgi:hypothetical protein